MRDLFGTVGFFLTALATFRLVYGSWPLHEGALLAWLVSDASARWALGASLVTGMIGAAIGRRLLRVERDGRVLEAKENARQGLAFHNNRQIPEAIEMFTRAIESYSQASRTVDAAPVYASLAKVYFDVEEYDLAEKNIQQALTLFGEWPRADEEIRWATLLLDTIWSRRRVSAAQSTYTDPVYAFSLTIPPNWGPQKLAPEFSRTGGRAAFSHRSHAATFNVSVGRLIEAELRLPEVRVVSVRDHLMKTVPDRLGSLTEKAFGSIAGESNIVTAEYYTRARVGVELRQRRNGFVSVVHNGLEFVFQWSAEAEYEAETMQIVSSFSFGPAQSS